MSRRAFALEPYWRHALGPRFRGVCTYKGYPELMRQRFSFPQETYTLVIHRVRHKIFADLAQETGFQGQHCRLHYGVAGRGVLRWPGGEVAFQPGRLFTLTRESPAWRPLPKPGRAESFVLEFDIENHVLAAPGIETVEAVHALRVPRLWTDLAPARRRAFEAEIFRLVAVMHDRPPSYALRARQQLLAIISLTIEWGLVELVNLRKENVGAHWHHYLWVEKARRFLHAHYAEKLGLRGIGRHVGADPDYLNQLFRRQTGATLNRYLNDLRIAKAKSLMLDGVTNVTTIALETGFQSPSYFSKCFHAATGRPPKAYLRQCWA